MVKTISRLPIRTKILSSSIITLLLVCVFIFTYYPYSEKKEINLAMQSKYHSMAEMIALGVGIGMHTSNFEMITEALRWAKKEPETVSIMALDENQEVIGNYNPSNTEFDIRFLNENDDIIQHNGKPLHIAKTPITYQNTEYGTLILVSSLENHYQRINEKSVTTLFISIAILFVGILLSLFFSRTITKPLVSLEQAAKNISMGNYDLKVEVHSEDEVGALGNSFNEMAMEINLLVARLEDEIEVSKRTQESLQKLSSAVEQTADIVFITNRDGIFEYVNPSFEKVSGYTSEEVLGKTPRILKSGWHDQSFYEHLWITILSGEVHRSIMINKKKNGEQFHSEQTIAPIKDQSGSITHFVSNIRDITERKRMEEEREKIMFELQNALANIKTLRGLIPICASCKKIRNDKGFWNQLETYIMEHSDATFSHGICPDCIQKLYPDTYERLKNKEKRE